MNKQDNMLIKYLEECREREEGLNKIINEYNKQRNEILELERILECKRIHIENERKQIRTIKEKIEKELNPNKKEKELYNMIKSVAG